MSIIKSTLAEDFNVKDVNGKLQVLDKNTGEYKPLEFTIIYNKLFVGDGSREQDALEQIKQKFESYGISIILDGNSRELKFARVINITRRNLDLNLCTCT